MRKIEKRNHLLKTSADLANALSQKDAELQKLRLDYLTLEAQCNEKDAEIERLQGCPMTTTPAPMTPEEIKAMREYLPGDPVEDFEVANEWLPRCLDEIERAHREIALKDRELYEARKFEARLPNSLHPLFPRMARFFDLFIVPYFPKKMADEGLDFELLRGRLTAEVEDICQQKDAEIQKLRLDYLTLETQCNEKEAEIERLQEELSETRIKVLNPVRVKVRVCCREEIGVLESRLQRSNELIKKAEEIIGMNGVFSKCFCGDGFKCRLCLSNTLLSDIEKHRQQSREGA